MRPRLRVSLSAVTSECGEARKVVASDLRSRGLEVKVQEDFRQELHLDTTLDKLHEYVRDCDVFIALVGTRSGGFPPPAAAAPYRHASPDGFDRASLTQWEVFFARHYAKKMLTLIAAPNYQPDLPEPTTLDEDSESQRRLIDYLENQVGRDRGYFINKEDAARLVLVSLGFVTGRPPPKSDRFVSIGSLFKGREGAMQRLRESLERHGRTAVTAKAQALHGMGGLGKTRLAIEYGLAHEKDYSALLFLSGETPAALEASLQGLAGVLGIEGHETMKEDARRREVLEWLRLHPGWFLVIDNLDTPEALRAAEGLLAHLSEGHAVITTRLSKFSAYFAPLELDVLSVEASVEFLLQRTEADRRATPDDAAEARAIARELGQLALALEQAGAYIAYHEQSFASYRLDWEKQRAEVLDWFDETITGYPRSVATTFLTSFRQLTDAARALLECLAFLAPEPVAESLLDVAIAGIDVNPKKHLAELARYSLVTRQREQRTFTLHRLVQDVVRRGLTAEQADARCVATLRWLIAAIDPARHPAPGARRAAALDLGLHAEAAAGHAGSSEARAAASYLLTETGNAFVEAGLLDSALRLHRSALDQDRALIAADPNNAARQHSLSSSHVWLGMVQEAQGNLPAALKSFRESLSLMDRLAKADAGNAGWRRDLSVSHNKVGGVLVSQGNLPEALASFRAGLEIAESLAKADPGNAGWRRDLSVSYDRVGDVLVSQGHLPEALASFRAGLEIAESLAKADPGNAGWRRDLSVWYEKVGDVFVAQGHLPEALASFRAGLEIRESLAKADPGNAGWQYDFGISNERIGSVLETQGDLAGALSSFRAKRAIISQLVKSDPGNAGWRHDLSVSYDGVGDVLVSQGNLPEALASFRAGLAIRESLAKADPGNAGWRRDLSVSYAKIADVHMKSNRPAEAREALASGRPIIAELVQKFPDWAEWKRDLAWFDAQIAALDAGG